MIKVMLAEDMHMVRGALVALLNLEPDIEVVAEVANGNDIVPTAMKYRPDVAVLDIDLPGKDGLSAVTELHDAVPGIRTLILTGLSRPGNLRRALSAKVTGFMLKDAPATQLADAIRSVAMGRRVVDSQLAMSAWDSAESPLTARETEVLRLTADGLQAVDIASKMFLSVGTVRNYLTTIIGKLAARNRVDAIRIARDAGWL
ncbi:response regulator transcription factor [Actinophytocola sp.]|jgi:two-component system, NarL family, response regulator DesR|uniref:response regulator transcription factor n=1 Tax=Actinophytocola sp. TaxID=1872138 RepID=UPI002D36D007|nr:response regulator transcription factor [Actinophytocola sp.]HYQ66907.1 response regulator transcription factor [Actinophytocola sp.]